MEYYPKVTHSETLDMILLYNFMRIVNRCKIRKQKSRSVQVSQSSISKSSYSL